jgi:hypothetical protein
LLSGFHLTPLQVKTRLLFKLAPKRERRMKVEEFILVLIVLAVYAFISQPAIAEQWSYIKW